MVNTYCYFYSSCEEDIDECASNPCNNGATCHNEIATFHCHCTEDYIGTTCSELKIKNCTNNQCVNGATCQDVYSEFENECLNIISIYIHF